MSEPTANPRLVREATALLITGARPDIIARTLAELHEADPEATRNALAEARRLIAQAAAAVPDQNRALAEGRVLEIYRQARDAQDWALALQAQKELSRLQQVYTAPPAQEDQETETDRELRDIRSYLEPLHPEGQTVSTRELARFVAELAIRSIDLDLAA